MIPLYIKFKSEYRSWANMKYRCLNKNSINYDGYGARGIKVSERWMTFENFIKDMGKRPKGKSLDRINNAGNYDSSNCRWASKFEQDNNRRSNTILRFNGTSQTIAQWTRELGFNRMLIGNRMKMGWPIERILTESSSRVRV